MLFSSKIRKFIFIFSLSLFGLAAFSILHTNKVYAASCSWNGSADGNWSNTANWDPGCSGTGGIPGGGDTLTFPTSSQYTMNNDISSLFVNSLIFSQGGAGAYTLSGNTIVVSSNVSVTTSSVVTISAVLAGTTLTKDGPGTLTFSGISNNLINTTFSVADGIVHFNKTSGAQSSICNVVVGDSIGTNQSAQLILDANEQISNGNLLTINGADGYVDFNGNNETLFDLQLNSDAHLDTQNGNLTLNSLDIDSGKINTGAGDLTLSGNITLNNAGIPAISSIDGARLILTAPVTMITVALGQFQALTISSNISGSGDLIFNGLIIGLSGNNSNFTGNIIVGATSYPTILGVLNSTTALGDNVGTTTIVDGSSLDLENVAGMIDEPINITGNGVGSIAGQDVGAIFAVDGISGRLSGNINLAGDTRITTGSGGALVIDGVISGNHNLTIKGTQEPGLGVALNNTNTFVGTTTVIDTGLYVVHTNTLDDGSPVILQNSGLFIYADELTGPISGDGTIGINSGVFVEVVYPSGSSTFSGSIYGDGDFVKYGTGNLTLSGNSPSFTGHFYNVEGPVTVNGDISNSLVETQSGIMYGTGTLGNTNSSSGGLNPGELNGTGILNIKGDLITNSGGVGTQSFFNVDLNGTVAGSDYDQVNVTGDVNIAGANLNITAGYTPADGTIFTILQSSGTISGTFIGLPNLSTVNVGGKDFTIVYTDNSVELVRAAVLFLPTYKAIPNTEYVGNPVVLYIKWSGSSSVPTGSVTFLDGSTSLGTVALNTNGEASLTIYNFSVGNHTITAQYSGDGTYGGAIPNSILVSILPAPVATNNPSETPTSFPASYTTVPTSYPNQVNLTDVSSKQTNDQNTNNTLIVIFGTFAAALIIFFGFRFFRLRKMKEH